MKKEVLMKAERLMCSVADYKIISFGISVPRRNVYAGYICPGSLFSSQVKDIIYIVTPGQKFLIEKVKARKPDGTIVSIRGMTILVE